MAFLIRGKIAKVASCSILSTTVRAASSHSNEIQRSVFISQSNDIFSNLALEDWLYRNSDFSHHRVLLLWRSAPCVVIGRHQNPWREAHIGTLAEQKITLARRNSGGGTVYHDQGNLNMSFLTPREAYNRKTNLSIISNALRREWGIESLISPRDDLILEGNFKVSF
jgi:lipoyltransferase 1